MASLFRGETLPARGAFFFERNVGAMFTSKELHEQITAYVDSSIDTAAYRSKVEGTIGTAPEGRREYEAELAPKLVVRDKSARPASSNGVRGSLESGITKGGDAAPPTRVEPEPKVGFLAGFYADFVSSIGIVLALGLVGLGIYLLVGMGPSEPGKLVVAADDIDPAPAAKPRTTPENFLNQASKNFRSILRHELGVAIESSDAKEVLDYFKTEGVTSAVELLPVRATLVGGLVMKQGPGEALKSPHAIWQKGETLVYLWQIEESALQKGDVFYLTPDALEKLDKGEKMWQEFDGAQTLVAFKRGSQIFVVVANIDRTEFPGVIPGI